MTSHRSSQRWAVTEALWLEVTAVTGLPCAGLGSSRPGRVRRRALSVTRVPGTAHCGCGDPEMTAAALGSAPHTVPAPAQEKPPAPLPAPTRGLRAHGGPGNRMPAGALGSLHEPPPGLRPRGQGRCLPAPLTFCALTGAVIVIQNTREKQRD